MEIVDLTHIINETMPVYPGSEEPVITDVAVVQTDGYAEKRITFFSHTGTHMDAPAHIFDGASQLDDLNVSCFMGVATVVDLREHPEKMIEIEDFEPYVSKLRTSDFVLLNTGWSCFWGKDTYFDNYPVLSSEACKWLLSFNLKGIGVDMISVDPVDSHKLPNHRIILKSGMVIVENLVNLDSIESDMVTFSAFPLKIESSDGAPVRAVAF